MIIHVVTGMAGEHESTTWWVAAAFRAREQADAYVAEVRAEWQRIIDEESDDKGRLDVSWSTGPSHYNDAWPLKHWDREKLAFTHDLETKLQKLDPRAAGCTLVQYGQGRLPDYDIVEVDVPDASDTL